MPIPVSTVFRSISKLVASESDASSLGARVTLPHSPSDVSVGKLLSRPPQPKRSKTFFGTLTNKLRVRTPAPKHTLDSVLDEPERAGDKGSLHKKTFRPQAVSIVLPNDIASRERRAEALRARGLLPPRSQALSTTEAEEDRRIGALQVNSLSSPGPDGAHSDAREIAESWRSMWLSLGPTTADAAVNSVPEVISPIDVSGDDGLNLSTEVDIPTLGPRDGRLSIPKPLLSDTYHSTVPSLRAASPAGLNDKQEARPSRSALRSPSSEGLTGLAQQSVPSSPRPGANLPVGKPQTEIVGDSEIHSPLSTPPSPAPSKRSFLKQLPIIEEPWVLLPTSASQWPVSPPRGPEDVPTLPPSPRFMLSPRPAPSSPLLVPSDLSASQQITIPDASSLRLRPPELDTLMASPTSLTVPSLLHSPSSAISHSTVFTDIGETLALPASYTTPVKGRRADLSPVTVNSSEGGFLCEEIIVETSFPEDDLDPFAGPQSTAPVNNLKVDVSAANPPRREPLAFLGKAKKRASTLDPPPIAGVSRSASMGNLRRSMSALRARACSRSTVTLSPVVDIPPRSPPLSPMDVTTQNDASILALVSLIDDEETRRLTGLAYM
ncbi:hypothetical protein BJY52DRAFT_1303890 [Lactarius psammicola]|nr:hypothetical protein BJY52DRAFT_1303890 [Lactarius psammicola]